MRPLETWEYLCTSVCVRVLSRQRKFLLFVFQFMRQVFLFHCPPSSVLWGDLIRPPDNVRRLPRHRTGNRYRHNVEAFPQIIHKDLDKEPGGIEQSSLSSTKLCSALLSPVGFLTRANVESARQVGRASRGYSRILSRVTTLDLGQPTTK